MPGSGVTAPVSVCDIAVPLRLHSNAVDRIAIAEGATKLDDDLMTISDQSRTDIPSRHVTRYHTYPIGHNFPGVDLSKRNLPMTAVDRQLA
jgi:hypothetical protein